MPIQYLRGIAALAVVLAHITSHQRPLLGEAAVVVPEVVGVWGVDIFFVISGFIIFHITKGAPSGLPAAGAFLGKRIIRIVPAYWFFTLLVFFIGKYNLFNNPDSSATGVMLLVKSLFFIKPGFPLLFVGWTLTLEMFFYLAFAVCMVFMQDRNRLFFLTVFFVGFSLLPSLIDSDNRYFRFYTQAILLEFVAGMLIAGYYESLSSFIGKRFAACILLSGCVMLLWVNCIFDIDTLTRNRAFFWGVPAVLVVCGALYLSSGFSSTILAFLGSISYSLYLCHMICVYVVATVVSRSGFSGVGAGWVYLLVALLASLLLATASYLFFEKYVDGRLRKLLRV